MVGLPRKGHPGVRERLDSKPRRDNSYCAAINGPQRGLKTCRRTQNIKFVGGLNLNTNTKIGEKIVGKDSRAIGQIVSVPNATDVNFVYLNGNKFAIGEVIEFKESGIETILQGTEKGNFIDRTENYNLDKGHKLQYCDFSKIVRKAKSAIPSKKLLIIFDKYQVASGNTGDFFSVNSYTCLLYTSPSPRD